MLPSSHKGKHSLHKSARLGGHQKRGLSQQGSAVYPRAPPGGWGPLCEEVPASTVHEGTPLDSSSAGPLAGPDSACHSCPRVQSLCGAGGAGLLTLSLFSVAALLPLLCTISWGRVTPTAVSMGLWEQGRPPCHLA